MGVIYDLGSGWTAETQNDDPECALVLVSEAEGKRIVLDAHETARLRDLLNKAPELNRH